jgi:hypothetical protein
VGETEFATYSRAFWRAVQSAQDCAVTVRGETDRIERWETHAHEDGHVVLRIATCRDNIVLALPADRAVTLLEGSLEVARKAAEVPSGSAYR